MLKWLKWVFFLWFQIYADGDFHHFVDGLDETRSNWMRYVNPARSAAEQNLAACQNGMEIYFYTVKPVPAGAELLVWYCHEFARRLRYPSSGELMMQKLSKFRNFLKSTIEQSGCWGALRMSFLLIKHIRRQEYAKTKSMMNPCMCSVSCWRW